MIPEPIRLLALDEAMILYGAEIVEEPDGSNKGFFIEMMQEKFGGQPGWAWCMYAVQWWYYRAFKAYLQDSPFLKYKANGEIDLAAANGHCYSVWHHVQPPGGIVNVVTTDEILAGYKILTGAIYIRYDADKTGHTGLVVSHFQDDNNHQNDRIRIIEGNASDGVRKREYRLRQLIDKNLKGIIT